MDTRAKCEKLRRPSQSTFKTDAENQRAFQGITCVGSERSLVARRRFAGRPPWTQWPATARHAAQCQPSSTMIRLPRLKSKRPTPATRIRPATIQPTQPRPPSPGYCSQSPGPEGQRLPALSGADSEATAKPRRLRRQRKLARRGRARPVELTDAGDHSFSATAAERWRGSDGTRVSAGWARGCGASRADALGLGTHPPTASHRKDDGHDDGVVHVLCPCAGLPAEEKVRLIVGDARKRVVLVHDRPVVGHVPRCEVPLQFVAMQGGWA